MDEKNKTNKVVFSILGLVATPVITFLLQLPIMIITTVANPEVRNLFADIRSKMVLIRAKRKEKREAKRKAKKTIIEKAKVEVVKN